VTVHLSTIGTQKSPEPGEELG